ncbi:MAG: PEGA domain-containing protein [Phycisphaera sp.]|nr:PEGA domain-containing protein [Phycisphaera sp.]
MHAMIRKTCLIAIFAALPLLTSGCIQRTITIESDPPGALAYLNDVEVGRTPVTVPFKFYGVYDVRIELEGYETIQQPTEAKAPIWEAPGPDLIAEAIPGNHEVNLKWQYTLGKLQPVDEKQLVERARMMRRELNPDAAAPEGEAPAEDKAAEGDKPAEAPADKAQPDAPAK